MARFSAVLDACVLVPIAQAGTLLHLAEAGLCRPVWSGRILDETVRALEAMHPDMRGSRGGNSSCPGLIFRTPMIGMWSPPRSRDMLT